MRVLVTRPASQQQNLCDALAQAVFTPTGLPMLEIVAIAHDAPAAQLIQKRIKALGSYQHVIFISANAVECGMAWVTECWPPSQDTRWPAGLQWYAIGRATALQLASYGVEAVAGASAMNSETLLMQPGLLSVSGQRILIVRGVGGRETLAHTLRERGAVVDYCEVYERRSLSYPPGTLQKILAENSLSVIANSGETVQALLDQAQIEQLCDTLLQLPLVVPGERVAQLAQQRGFTKVIVAKNASADASVAALQTLTTF